MNKVIIVINGKGGVGKDTLCKFAEVEYSVMNISAVDPIKEAAKVLGMKDKDLRARQFLADLRKLSAEYNDYPLMYLVTKTNEFLSSTHEVLFVHIREPEEIQRYLDAMSSVWSVPIKTMLVQRDTGIETYGNSSDDGVDNYTYDIYFDNNCPMYVAEARTLQLIYDLLKGGKGR